MNGKRLSEKCFDQIEEQKENLPWPAWLDSLVLDFSRLSFVKLSRLPYEEPFEGDLTAMKFSEICWMSVENKVCSRQLFIHYFVGKKSLTNNSFVFSSMANFTHEKRNERKRNGLNRYSWRLISFLLMLISWWHVSFCFESFFERTWQRFDFST